MIYTLTMIVCLISAPTDCRPHEELLYGGVVMPPLVEAQTTAAKWLDKHPGVYLKSMRLEQGRGS